MKNVTVLFFTGHPVKTQNEFDSFSQNLEITLDKLVLNNPFMLVVIGDLNAK